MKIVLVATLLAIAAVAIVAPTAAAQPDGFGHCELKWYSYGTYQDPLTGEWKDIEAPGGFECYW